jgi:hypothetical protein
MIQEPILKHFLPLKYPISNKLESASLASSFHAKDTLSSTLLQKGNKFITLTTEINEGDTFHHPQPDIDDKTTDTDQVKNILQISQLSTYK